MSQKQERLFQTLLIGRAVSLDLDGSHKKANYSSPLDSSSVFWVSGHFLLVLQHAVSAAQHQELMLQAGAQELGMLLLLWTPFSQLKLRAVCGFLEPCWLWHLQPSQSHLWLSNLFPPCSFQLLTTLVSQKSLLPAARLNSLILQPPLAVAGYSLVLGVSALYTTSPVHPTRNKISKLNTQTSGCAHIGVSLTAGHSAQEEDPADCCLRETLVMFTQLIKHVHFHHGC